MKQAAVPLLLNTRMNALRWVSAVLLAISITVFAWLLLNPVTFNSLRPMRMREIMILLMAVVGSGAVKALWPQAGWAKAVLGSALLYSGAYMIATFIPQVSTYPLSMGWSEASRYYYGSLFLSGFVYGKWVPTSVLHASRYLLEAVPFLIPSSPIWLSRLWQVLLWLVTGFGSGWLLCRRLGLKGAWMAGLFTLWSFLFLMQGPVYYHLLVMVMLVLWGFDRNHFRRSMLVVVAASIWGGLSRINWVPMPGLMAVMLYVMEEPLSGKNFWRYWLPPASFAAAGGIAGLAAEKAYEFLSGNPSWEFGSSLTSDLLWYRLRPSVTYPTGVLDAIVKVSFPLGLLLLALFLLRFRSYSIWRWLALAAVAGVLFAGGVVVSVKIGGGSNLHNMDAFLVVLWLAGSYAWASKFTPDQPVERPKLLDWIAPLVILVTVYFTLAYFYQPTALNFQKAEDAVRTIREMTQTASSQGGRVLFIRERQLLTFHELQGVPLDPDYEVVFLQEMAMANNRRYLDMFYQDLREHRFAVIVSDILLVNYEGSDYPFGEENDAWVSRVSVPVLCYYQPSQVKPEVGVEILVPRDQPCKK